MLEPVYPGPGMPSQGVVDQIARGAVGRRLIYKNTRTDLAATNTSAKFAYLLESGREGIFKWVSTNQSAAVATDPLQGVYVPPASDSTGASGAWVRQYSILYAQHFGAVGYNNAIDDGPAINAFINFVFANNVAHATMYGKFYISTPIVIDNEPYRQGVSVEPPRSVINWGGAILIANADMDRLVSMNEYTRSNFHGKVQLQGHPTYASDVIYTANARVGVYMQDCLSTNFDGFDCQRFVYAGVELFSQPTINNNIDLGQIYAKRCGSGDNGAVGRQLLANWSGATQSGAMGSISQYTEMTVDTLPHTYITGSVAGAPEKPILVEISGKLHEVTYVDRATNTIRVFPRTLTALGASGSLAYHYGGAMVMIDGDSNVISWTQVIALMCGTAVGYYCLYGGAGGNVLAESCGSAVHLGVTTSAVLSGGIIPHLYCESSNTFNVVTVTRALNNFRILARSADVASNKDVNVHTALNTISAVEGYYQEGLIGLTQGAGESTHYRRKRFVDGRDNPVTLDFSKPATFDKPIYFTPSSDLISITLVAPTAGYRENYSYDCASVHILGRSTEGAMASTITLTPPAGHTINGVAGAATYRGFSTTPILTMYYDGGTAWTVATNRDRQGLAGVATKGNVDVTLTPYTDKRVQRFTTNLTADRAVTLSTTGAVEGNEFTIARPAAGAFNLNVGSGPLKALAASQWCRVVFDGTNWQLVSYGSL